MHRVRSKPKKSPGNPWTSGTGWKALDVADDFLLGAEEGGFAGLEMLDYTPALFGAGKAQRLSSVLFCMVLVANTADTWQISHCTVNVKQGSYNHVSLLRFD